jgi:predicted nucleic acid-binding protein
MTTVLDSWTVLRYFEDEGDAASEVAELLTAERPLISWINLGEVFYVIRRTGGEDAASSTVRDLRDVVDAELPDEQRGLQAGRIKSEYPLPYAAAFAAATTQAHGTELWTGYPQLLVQNATWTWRDLR